MTDLNKNLILLTGAGFTKNFDGFLANEMWSKIFNNVDVQSNEKIRNVLAQDFDFESVCSQILRSGSYNDNEKDIIKKAVESAYKDLDDTVKRWNFDNANPTALNTHGLGQLLSKISSRGSNSGCFFTLNQDLFMEKYFKWKSPGITDAEHVVLPSENEMPTIKNKLNNASYIKLHGSYKWISSNGGNQMVIGKNKIEDINKEPLLNWYMEIFQNAIYEGNKKLLVIGYSFRDQHINDILLKGVQEHGLSLYIIDTLSPENFKNILEGKPQHNGSWEQSKYFPIWKGVKGYFPYSLREIYPPNQNTTTMAIEINKSLNL